MAPSRLALLAGQATHDRKGETVSGLFDKLLRRSAHDPEQGERIRCDLCGGTGIWTPSPGLPDQSLMHRYHGGHCPRCHGKGWLEVKRDCAD